MLEASIHTVSLALAATFCGMKCRTSVFRWLQWHLGPPHTLHHSHMHAISIALLAAHMFLFTKLSACIKLDLPVKRASITLPQPTVAPTRWVSASCSSQEARLLAMPPSQLLPDSWRQARCHHLQRTPLAGCKRRLAPDRACTPACTATTISTAGSVQHYCPETSCGAAHAREVTRRC